MLKKVLWLAVPVMGIAGLMLYSSCTPQCIDDTDCLINKGQGYICSSSNSCVAGSRTDAGSAGCTAATCTTGCCDSTGTCVGGTTDTACGQFGSVCTDCTQSGMLCTSSQCALPPCDVAHCPMGCCDATGVCQTMEANTACGTGATACVDCTQGGMSTQVCGAASTCINVPIDAGTCLDGGAFLADGGC